MEIYFNKEEKKESKIQLGDLFTNKEGSEAYVLIDISSIGEQREIEFPVVLQELDGEGNYDAYKDFDGFLREYDSSASNYLDWYPKDQYFLELKKK